MYSSSLFNATSFSMLFSYISVHILFTYTALHIYLSYQTALNNKKRLPKAAFSYDILTDFTCSLHAREKHGGLPEHLRDPSA